VSRPGNRTVARRVQAIQGAVSLGEKRRYNRVLETMLQDNPPSTLVACPHCNRSHWTDRLVGTGSFELCGDCKEKVATNKNKSKRT
jgi:hypothetical protein